MNIGGQETLIMNLLRNVNKEKFHFDILCTGEGQGDYDKEIKSLGSKVYHLEKNKLYNYKLLSGFGFVLSIIRFFKQHPEINIIHIHNCHSYSIFLQLLGARLGGKTKFIIHSHSSSADTHSKSLHKSFLHFMNIFQFKKIACSDLAAQWLFLNSKNVTILKNGVDLSNFGYKEESRKVLRDKLNIEDKFVLIHVGRFSTVKNHQFIIDIFKNLKKYIPNSALLLVGTGELEKEIQNKVQFLKLEDSVQFLGLRKDVSDLLSASDLFLFPSLYEGLPVTLVEAQSSGINCLISDTISKESILCDNCIPYPLSSSSEEWAKEILHFSQAINRANAIQQIKQKGFDIKDVTNEIEKIYISI